MKKDVLKKGAVIITDSYSKLVCTGYNGSVVYFDEFELNPETEENDIPAGQRMLTLSEVANELKRVDGRNHKVVWESVE